MRRMYPAKLLEVRGTDMLDVELDLGFNVYTRQKIRLFGVASQARTAMYASFSLSYVKMA